jgi:pyruvate kinase
VSQPTDGQNTFDVIATITDRALTQEFLTDLTARGATILRVNGAHASSSQLKHYIDAIHQAVGSQVKVLIDVPGNKVRTTNFPGPLVVEEGKALTLDASHFNYPEIIEYIRPGHVLLAADATLRFRVDQVEGECVRLIAETSGVLGNGKGVHLVGIHTELPFMSARDMDIIQSAATHGADLVGLSFVRSVDDIREARALLQGTSTDIICKIETQEACDNIHDILARTPHVLIDRGDLSSEIGMFHVPQMESMVATAAKAAGVKMFVATQILAHMVDNPLPSMSEVAALHALMSYADGVQLSDETTVGQYPLESLEVVRQIRAGYVSEEIAGSHDDPTVTLTTR